MKLYFTLPHFTQGPIGEMMGCLCRNVVDVFCRVEFVPVCEKNTGTRRVKQMKNIFVPELTVKAADKMEIYETYRIRNEIKG